MHPLNKLYLFFLNSRCFNGRWFFELRKKKIKQEAERMNKASSRREDMLKEMADPEITFLVFASSPCLIKVDLVFRNMGT